MKQVYRSFYTYIPAIISLSMVLFPYTARYTHAQDTCLFSFGNGKTDVRVYTDYFCGPCRDLEPKIEPLLTGLLKKNIITVAFIDAPFHKHSATFTRYYLYALNEKKDLAHALKARHALIEAAKQKVVDTHGLESFLQQRGIGYRLYDATATLRVFQGFMREDKINATPSMVIITDDKKQTYKGANEIVAALTRLGGTTPKP